MARTRTYNHFCPVARSLEVIGEKWSLLIVRDLLRGPQRFTDLLRGLNNITPKWLTLRLRELESAGIVERDQEPGRKEVRYRLTEKGQKRLAEDTRQWQALAGALTQLGVLDAAPAGGAA